MLFYERLVEFKQFLSAKTIRVFFYPFSFSALVFFIPLSFFLVGHKVSRGRGGSGQENRCGVCLLRRGTLICIHSADR